VTPDTVLRWHRKLVAKKHDGRERRGPGRPRTASEIAELAVRIVVENPRSGSTRIRDALGSLGHEVGRDTVKRIMAEHGLERAPEGRRRTPRKTYLGAHGDAFAATDVFTVEALG